MGHGASTKALEGATLARRAGSLYAPAPQRVSVTPDIGNILCCPFGTNAIDLTGNHTVDDGTPVFSNVTQNHYTYDSADMLEASTDAGTAPRVLADSQAHQIPLANPVTFGFFMRPSQYNGSPYFMCSGAATATGNYGIHRSTITGWHHTGTGFTALGDYEEITEAPRTFHVALAISGGRGAAPAAEFYLNGTPVWSGNLGASIAPLTTHNLGLTAASTANDSNWHGHFCNAFISDTLLDPATIKNLSDESFGHASPWMI
jgi:hypothetical protein